MLAILFFATWIAQPVAAAGHCSYDRAGMLKLEQDAFDQSNTGWRTLASRGCNIEAADLIRDWRLQHKSTDSILYWHEGQSRAFAGQIAQAIALFELSRQSGNGDPFGWNPYVDGTIAFLRRDRSALQFERDKLAALPRPADIPADLHMTTPDGKDVAVPWPFNLDKLDGFLACWDRPYGEAYGCGPRK